MQFNIILNYTKRTIVILESNVIIKTIHIVVNWLLLATSITNITFVCKMILHVQ